MSDDRSHAPGPLGVVQAWVERHPSGVDVLLAAAATAVLAPSSLELVLEAALDRRWVLVLVVAVFALHAAMVFRRSRPLLSYAAACAGMLLLTLAPYLDSGDGQAVPAPLVPSALLFFVLLFTAADQTTSRIAAGCLVVALLGGAIVLVRLSLGRPWWSQVTGQSAGSAWLVLTAMILAGAVGAYSLGRLRRTRRAYLLELRERARRTEAERVAEAAEAAAGERRRIAREMHDVVSHSLAVMISQAEGGRMLSSAAATPEAAGRSATVFATIADTGRAAMADMRAMLGVLREADEPTPSVRAPQPGLVDLPALLDQVRSTGCQVTLTESGTATELSPSTGLAVYRLIQESLTNVVKHAGPGASAEVELDWAADGLRVEVHDDGLDPAGVTGGGATGVGVDGVGVNGVAVNGVGVTGVGLTGMRERVEAVGGSLQVGPGAEAQTAAGPAGWRVVATVPTRKGGRPT